MSDPVSTAMEPMADAEILSRLPGRVPRRLMFVLLGLVGAGALGFLLGLVAAPQRAWQAFLVNFLFFSGLGSAGVLFGAVMQLAKGHWGKPLYRIAQGFGAFLPISYVLFFVLYPGRERIFPWLTDPVSVTGHPIQTAWLNPTGIFATGGVFLLLFYLICLAFMYYSLRPDMLDASGRLTGWRRRLTEAMARGWRGDREETARSRQILARLAPVLALAYVAVLSGMAIDLIMSLTPGWISVLFPAYFFVGAWLSALAGLAVMAAVLQKRLGLEAIESNHWHDLTKLMFAFCIFWAYLWFSQYLPIWYGNMPRETIFVEIRSAPPWTAVSVAFFLCVFAIPFVLLLGQRPKMMPRYVAGVAALILVGFWIERFDMVVPALWNEGVPLGWVELLVTAGYLGLFGLSYAAYATTVPLNPVRESLILGKPRSGPY